jgi:signal transduction histidine kinase/CheY-like chemotaxis protein
MASTLAEAELTQLARPAEPSETEAARAARIAERTDALCLKQMLAMGRQSYILMPSVFFIAWLAVREGAVVWAGVWFVAWVARMVYVFRLVGELRRHPEAPPGPALRAVVKGYVFAGVVAGCLLPVFFARSSDLVLVVVTFLVTTYGSTMMIASSGVLRAGLGYGVPTLGTLITGWLWHGGVLGYGLAAFLALSFALSIVAIRSQRKALTEVVRVIDDNESLSAALARERDRAASVSESKTRFFAAASHDLRQPLHALSINATTLDLIARRSDHEVLKEVSQGIGSALRQSRGLLDGLLDISRLDANAVLTRMAAHDVHELLAAVRDEYAALAAQRGLRLQVVVDGGGNPGGTWVTTDADQLLRILGNLVDNAIKFTREGTVSLSARPASGARVIVRVSDTGPGIAESEHERVFEEFYQVGNPSRDRSQGLGLGLAIVKRTAVLLGAPLHLISPPGAGATFELSLPGAAAEAAEAPPSRIGGDRTALSVLLVDDEPALLNALCTYLQQLGWQARGVASGTQALQMLNDGFRADVVVIDYRLREETGVDVMNRLRAVQGDLRVVIVTGDTAATRVRELSALGVMVLHKPVDGERLARALLDAVQHRPVATTT